MKTARKAKPALAAIPDPLRDEIALRVMTTLLSVDPRSFFDQITLGNGPASFRNIATISYAMADAMLRERG